FAPKGRNNVAQGRAAHPGYRRHHIPRRPERAQHLRARMFCPFRAWLMGALLSPRVRCATLGYVVWPLRGGDGTAVPVSLLIRYAPAEPRHGTRRGFLCQASTHPPKTPHADPIRNPVTPFLGRPFVPGLTNRPGRSILAVAPSAGRRPGRTTSLECL